MIALFSGRHTVILTRDGDVLEQFDKFTNLLTNHYQSMLFADLYAANRDAFATKPMRLGVPELHFYFDPAESFLVRKHVANPDDFVAALLPPEYQPVRLTCLLFGGIPPDMTLSYLSFHAEKNMDSLLQVKGRTGGLSTDKLGGKNCHVTGFPVGIDDPREWVLITKDNTLSGDNKSSITFAWLDLVHTAYHRQVLTQAPGPCIGF